MLFALLASQTDIAALREDFPKSLEEGLIPQQFVSCLRRRLG
jgi:hypothetical protein